MAWLPGIRETPRWIVKAPASYVTPRSRATAKKMCASGKPRGRRIRTRRADEVTCAATLSSRKRSVSIWAVASRTRSVDTYSTAGRVPDVVGKDGRLWCSTDPARGNAGSRTNAGSTRRSSGQVTRAMPVCRFTSIDADEDVDSTPDLWSQLQTEATRRPAMGFVNDGAGASLPLPPGTVTVER